MLVLSFAWRDFTLGTPVFPTPQKTNMTMNQVDEEPLCGCATSKSFIHLFIYFIYNSYLVNESQHLRDIWDM